MSLPLVRTPTRRERNGRQAVINLMILEGDEQEPEGWTKVSKDLNAGAGGKYVYLLHL
ncbi:hypothetical protein ACFYWU_06945 [Streptomyces chrestomyceticus]|uniref:hypothetical protein n=1 Tax=Streptomyces chrestomyceticus TaxID=68185 RepID=UPI0036C31DA7